MLCGFRFRQESIVLENGGEKRSYDFSVREINRRKVHTFQLAVLVYFSAVASIFALFAGGYF